MNAPRLASGLLASERPAWICAEIEGEASILGRWQRRGGRVAALRRMAGGRTLRIPGRAILVLLGLPHWNALGAPDPERILNRHVRPLLRAMTRVLRRNVAYFGRDHLVTGGAAAAWIGQAVGNAGATLVEAFVGATPAPAPPHPDPRFDVRGDATLPPFDAFVAALAEAAGAAVTEEEPFLAEPPAEESEAGFIASGAVPVPIGFAEALVRHDGAEVVAARLRGDVQGPLDVLGDALTGVRLEAGALHAALARAQGEPGFFLLGVRDASVFAELVLTTRDAALAGLAEKYRTLATLRGRRDAFLAAGGERFADAELAERGAAFRAVAARYPGALRQLEALPAETLAARAVEVEAARGAGRPVATPWIRVVLDFHGTLAAAIASRPPRPRPHILDVVFDELAARHDAPRGTLEAMVFGAARG